MGRNTLCSKKKLCNFCLCIDCDFCWSILTILSPLQSEMTNAYPRNRIFHLTLTALAHYLTKHCAANINISYIFCKKYRSFEQAESHQTGQIRLLWVSSYGVLRMSALRMNICLTPFYTISRRMDNFLVRIAPELNQSLLQFVNAMDVSLVNMLLQGRLCLTVKS